MKIIITMLTSLIVCTSLWAQDVAIIPKPQVLQIPKESSTFYLNNKTTIYAESSTLLPSVAHLQRYAQRYYGIDIKSSKKKSKANQIQLTLDPKLPKTKGHYILTSDNSGIKVSSSNPEGIFYGVQTIYQLMSPQKSKTLAIRAVSIVDSPVYSHRGMMLDVSRHFFDTAFVKEFIDYIAMHKMNVFHWHLTDDQGWRIEIKKYQRLTEVGAWRKQKNGTTHGGFYTQEEVKAIVKYAADRYITVIPEIELPGHSAAAIAAYPELSVFPDRPTYSNNVNPIKQVPNWWGILYDVFIPSENTFTFFENVLGEVMELFPSQYIHIGGDEVKKNHWDSSPVVQQIMKDKGIANSHDLQSYFIKRIEKMVNAKGKTIIGWDEILEGGLAPNAVLMSWRSTEGGRTAAKAKHYAIMAPYSNCYFDYKQSSKEDSITQPHFLPLSRVYAFEPRVASLSEDEKKYILGGQANLWTEYVDNIRKVQYMIFPRMSAMSEVLWTSHKTRDYTDFKTRLNSQEERYKLWDVHYFTRWRVDE